MKHRKIYFYSLNFVTPHVHHPEELLTKELGACAGEKSTLMQKSDSSPDASVK